MKLLFILLFLLLFGMQQGVAAEKQQQTNLQNEVVGNNADNGTTPISVDAVYEFLQKDYVLEQTH